MYRLSYQPVSFYI